MSRTTQTKTRRPVRRVAIMSDVHGNLPALTAVLADAKAQGVTEWLCLGDVVGYGPQPADCINLLRSMKMSVLLGNHDAEAAMPGACTMRDHARKAIDWTRRQLSPTQVTWLRKLPVQYLEDKFEAVHSSLLHPLDWNYVFEPMVALFHFLNQTRPVCFCGHTHVPAIWELEGRNVEEMVYPMDRPFELKGPKKWLLNVGSVGQPRDGDPRACYLIFSPYRRRVEYRRVAYEVGPVAQAVLDAGLPRGLASRLLVGT